MRQIRQLVNEGLIKAEVIPSALGFNDLGKGTQVAISSG